MARLVFKPLLSIESIRYRTSSDDSKLAISFDLFRSACLTLKMQGTVGFRKHRKLQTEV